MEVNSSVEDLLGFSSSFRDSEYFKDLEEGIPAAQSASTVPESQAQLSDLQVAQRTNTPAINQPVQTSLTTHSLQIDAPSLPCCSQPAEEPRHSYVITQLLTSQLLPSCITGTGDSSDPSVGLSLTINLNGLVGSMEPAKGITASQELMEHTAMELDGDLDNDSFPILVRSMSTSRRHSWGVPVSPINLGRR